MTHFGSISLLKIILWKHEVGSSLYRLGGPEMKSQMKGKCAQNEMKLAPK